MRGATPYCFAGPLSEWDVGLGGASLNGRRPSKKSRLMVSQEDAMDIPANGVARLPEDVVVGTRYIYTLALALVGLALATCATLFLMIDF